VFRKGKDSRVGSYEPLPEGLWRMHQPEWKNGKNKYEPKDYSAGLGPVRVRLDYKKPGTTERAAIEIHIDANRERSPGTAGCLGVQTRADFKKLAGWLDDDPSPKDLYVDYGLGSCPDMP
jgi:lysozyme